MSPRPAESGAAAGSAQRFEPVVISGIAGRMPESDNMQEFKENLFNNVDMVTEDDRRWTPGLHGVPDRTSKIKDLSSFDAQFFGVHAKQARVMDPQLRLLLEATHEVIVDAGISPEELRGTRTGVFVGVNNVEPQGYWVDNGDPDPSGYILTGCCHALFANRISYHFDLNGPSYAVNTASSSSTHALHQGLRAIRAGECETAIVAGTNLALHAKCSMVLNRLNMISPDGRCKTFDAAANGYARCEAVVVMLLQKAKDARRVYATVLNTGTNADGYKKEGVTYPSGAMQAQLIRRVLGEAGVDPLEISYFEAHGTGTGAGDPQEANSVVEIFCKGRKGALPIGAVKSNIGHGEPAAGLCSVSKVLIAMEADEIPANLHYKNPNPKIPGLTDGSLLVIDKNTPWKGGIVGINSFGVGGTNAHVLVKSNPKNKDPNFVIPDSLPYVIVASGRTEEAVNYMLTQAEQDRDVEFHALLAQVHSRPIGNHLYRGFSVLRPGAAPAREVGQAGEAGRPVWWVFSGMGTQWPAMGRDLMQLQPFADAIKTCAAALRPHNLDLLNVIVNGDAKIVADPLNALVGVVAVQVALVDTLRALGMEPDGIVGHSVGELGCSYADGGLTAQQAVLGAYWRGRSITDAKLPTGAMAAIGLSWEETKARVPADIFPACHNAAGSVTVSGPPASITRFCEQLRAEGVTASEVDSSGVAFHSKYIAAAGPAFKKSLQTLIPDPKPRTSRWLSSSIAEKDWGTQLAKLCSADYHANNLLSPVLFAEVLQHVPDDAIVLEIAPHALLQAVIRRGCAKGVTPIGLMKKDVPDNLNFALSAIGKAFVAGAQPQVGRLLPPVSYPVSRGTRMIGPLVRWDHSTKWPIPDLSGRDPRLGRHVTELDIVSRDSDKFLAGHTVHGRVVYPPSAFLHLVWKTFAMVYDKCMQTKPAVFEDVQFLKNDVVLTDGPVALFVGFMESNGAFEVRDESGTVLVTGRISSPVATTEELFTELQPIKKSDSNELRLSTADVYQELRLRGHRYTGAFQGVKDCDNHGREGTLRWDDNWVAFLDAVFQFGTLGELMTEANLPTSVQRLVIDPRRQKQAVSAVGEEQLVAAVKHADVKVIRAGGVEVSGLEVGPVARVPDGKTPAKLEKYVFVPFCNDVSLEAGEGGPHNAALITALQTAAENLGALNMKIVELAGAKSENALLAGKIEEALEREPMLHGDVTVVSSALPALSPSLEELGVKLVKGDAEALPSDAHIVVAADLADRPSDPVWRHIVDAVRPGGFVILEDKLAVDATKFQVQGLVRVAKQAAGNRSIILLRKVGELETPTVIKVSNSNFSWVEPLKAAMAAEKRAVIVSQGEENSGIVGMLKCLADEPGGQGVRAVLIQDPKAAAFDPKLPLYADQLAKDLRVNVLREGGVWGCFRHLRIEGIDGPVPVEHAFFDAATSRWLQAPPPSAAQPGTQPCSVYYAALEDAGLGGVLGGDFSGRDAQGRRVMGVAQGGALATTALADPALLWEVPAQWSLEQAASAPASYALAYLALAVRGRVRAGESVLVHDGASPLGRAALAVALQAGCTALATVHSAEERRSLRQAFSQLDDANVVAATKDFQRAVLARTAGKGVDVALCALADGEAVAAAARSVSRQGGRLVGIGGSNSSLPSSVRGISLQIVSSLPAVEKEEVARLVAEGLKAGAVRPLPVTVFAAQRAEEATRLVASDPHAGKVLVQLRGDDGAKAVQPVPKALVPAEPRTFMHPDKSYVLVGGLGGFGLELAQWLVERGASKLVLTSRSGVRSGYQSLCVRRCREAGARVLVSTKDSTTEAGARALLSEAAALGPVGGIFNLAAVLRDAHLGGLTAEDFAAVCKPKVSGTAALDAASRALCPALDHFVCFSSMACGRGNPGQSAYCLANSAMERLCESRRAAGLPACTVQWGPVSDVGLMVDSPDDIVVAGLCTQSVRGGLHSLDVFMRQRQPVVSSIILAAKIRGGRKGSADTALQAVATILGFPDVKGLSPIVAFSSLGMDSLMGAEVQHLLAMDFGIVLSANEIRGLTLGELAAQFS